MPVYTARSYCPIRFSSWHSGYRWSLRLSGLWLANARNTTVGDGEDIWEKPLIIINDPFAVTLQLMAAQATGKLIGLVSSSQYNNKLPENYDYLGKDTERWYNSDGTPNYPPNWGFDGSITQEILEPGTLVDRYGYPGGSFASPKGTPYEQRSLPLGTYEKPLKVYKVLKPTAVRSGPAAPWFGQPGGGIQYMFDRSISSLIGTDNLVDVT